MSGWLENGEPSPAHWSKDFVEHLRTVHFALIAASIGLIVVAQSAKVYDPDEALKTIQEISTLRNEWSSKWLITHATKKEQNEEPPSDPHKVINPLSIDDVPDASKTDFSGIGKNAKWNGDLIMPDSTLPNSTVDAPNVDSMRYFTIPDSHTFYGTVSTHPNTSFQFEIRQDWDQEYTDFAWSPERFPDTLTDFGQWWDALDSRHFRAIFPRTIRMNDAHTFIDGKRASVQVSSKPATSQTKEKIEIRVSSLLGSVDYSGSLFFFPVGRFAYVDITQRSLSKEFRKKHLGSFASSFPELDGVADQFRSWKLDELEKYLVAERSKEDQGLEIAGVRLPAANITLWGIGALWSIQIYLLIYLKQIYAKLSNNDSGWDVPWIGMNQSTLARIFLFCSVVVLPCVAVGLLANHVKLFGADELGHVTLLRIGYMAAAILPAAFLGILCWLYRPRLRSTSVVQVSSEVVDVSEQASLKLDS